MSWIEKLYDTYERCVGLSQFEVDPLMPICHCTQQAHIEVTLDGNGTYKTARVLSRGEQATVIPCTEDSASRSSNEAPHPLCDKVQYCAASYAARGGSKKSYWLSYRDLLRNWCSSPHADPKAVVVLKYLDNPVNDVLADLIREKVVMADGFGKLLSDWKSDAPLPPLFKLLVVKQGRREQGDALIRWRVNIPGNPISATWEDPSLHRSWIDFYESLESSRGDCCVTGDGNAILASKHPRGIRWPGDGAKLISSNDESNYTFRGRFRTGAEACSIGFEVTQKAHNALRWLIARQGTTGKTAEQVCVAWSIGGQPIPDPLKNTEELFLESEGQNPADQPYEGDAGQLFALRLNKLIAGYITKIGSTDGVVVMGVDSATPGRMAMVFYRELTRSEFLARMLDWHSRHAWQQKYSKAMQFIGAPSPKDIAEAVFGRRLDDKLRKATVERLLPSIIDGQPVPRDLVVSAAQRVCNRVGLEPWEWEKFLGITCGLYRGWRKEMNYQMSLEEERTSRDYLYGRLLAVADHLEQRALNVAGENRDTSAARLMQRFASHPHSTWKSIELALVPYQARLRSKRPPLLIHLNGLLDEVMSKFQPDEFADDSKLSAEFLLGFHCQRSALWQKPERNTPEVTEEKI
jgi:CRISPR-associated protein Csd1